MGFAAPVIIPAAIILLFLALGCPGVVRRIAATWPFSLMPGSYTADPVRFAAMFALVSIPVSGIAGFAVYRNVLPGSPNGGNFPTPVSALVALASPPPALGEQTPTSVPPTATAVEPTPTAIEPTPTPLQPTPTRVPSKQVPSTSVPALPAMTKDQQIYLADLYTKRKIMSGSDELFAQLVDRISGDPMQMDDPSWQKQIDTQLGIWQAMYASSKDITAPAGLETINGKWIEFMGHKNLAADELSRGIHLVDSDLLTKGKAEMETSYQDALDLNALLDEFMSQFDGQPNVQFN
jgi:hypothetical protein